MTEGMTHSELKLLEQSFSTKFSCPGQEGGEEVGQAAPMRRLHRTRRLLREGHGAHKQASPLVTH